MSPEKKKSEQMHLAFTLATIMALVWSVDDACFFLSVVPHQPPASLFRHASIFFKMWIHTFHYAMCGSQSAFFQANAYYFYYSWMTHNSAPKPPTHKHTHRTIVNATFRIPFFLSRIHYKKPCIVVRTSEIHFCRVYLFIFFAADCINYNKNENCCC